MRVEQIQALNDAFRMNLDPRLGRITMTAGVAALSDVDRTLLLLRVQAFDAFTADNDPHGEHDFGSFTMAGRKFFWKIDYFDPTMTFESDDPADPSKTTRVLTIMLAEEY